MAGLRARRAVLAVVNLTLLVLTLLPCLLSWRRWRPSCARSRSRVQFSAR